MRNPSLKVPSAQLSPAGSRRPARQSVTGFTLVELIAVIAIVAILLTIGVPSYRDIQNSYRISSEVNGLVGDLQFARAQAIKEGQAVTACVSTDGTTCASNPSGWQQGWIVFNDVNNNQTVDTSAGDNILRVQQPFAGTDTFKSDSGATAVTFNREGFALKPSGGTTLVLHDATDNPVWTQCLNLSVIGMMTVTNHTQDPSCT